MKTIYLTAALMLALLSSANAQKGLDSTIDSLQHFNKAYWVNYAEQLKLTKVDQIEFVSAKQKQYIKDTYFPSVFSEKQPSGDNHIHQSCTNMDFESGNLNGWVTSTGFHPLYNNAGCCNNAGGAQTIVSGNGLDPCGGFPIVCPGGNFSLLLGNNQTGGVADRLEQTFSVTPANANFTYKYAVVFQDPGHTLAQQPSFQIEMIDSSGTQIPCTFYNVSAGQNIPGFVNSNNCAGVVYKPWTNVIVDLSNYIGQNVTIRFSTFDCSLGGHYGYAYIDGDCAAFQLASKDSICPGGTKNICAPPGFGSYTWNGPGIANLNNQCATVAAAGIYTVNTTLVTGCTGPVFTYSIYNYAKPNASINGLTASCLNVVSFTNNSTISSGFIASNLWNFGNGNTATSNNSSANYTSPGTYTVSLIVNSDKGCSDTAYHTVTIHPLPLISFSAPSVCEGAAFTFSNNSSIASGSIVAWSWNFGNSSFTSNLQNPFYTYPNFGNYVVTLSATSNFGCVATATIPLTVNPKPQVNFTSNNVCYGLPNNFNNTSNIASGNINGWMWDFNNDNFIDATNQNPNFSYPTAGDYSVTLTAVSNANCVNSIMKVVTVHPIPAVAFSANNNCESSVTSFTNQSTITNNNTIVSYLWNFGNGNTSSSANPQITYQKNGNYNVTLSATSNNNCSSGTANQVVVHPNPVVSFSATTTCFNQATQFTNNSSIPSGSITEYSWDFDDDGTPESSAYNPSFIYNTAGVFTAKLYAISDYSCISQFAVSVTVHANPKANFSANSACLGDKSNYKNLSISSDGKIIAHLWDFNGDNVPDNLSEHPVHLYPSNGVYLTKLEVQSEYGCVHVISKPVYVNAKPVAQFTAFNKEGCPSLCVNFKNQSYISNGSIVTNQWLFGDNSLPNYAKNPTYCYGTGTYSVSLKVVSDSGCISSFGIDNYVKVYESPIAGFAVTPDYIDEDQPMIDVNDRSSNAVAVQYFLNDGSYYNKDNFQHNVNVGKLTQKLLIYQLVKNQYGCSDSAYRVIDVKPSFVIYVPNAFTPNGDGLNDGFQAKGVGIEKFEMQIYDRWGHLIFETDDINKVWDGTVKNGGDLIKNDTYVWKAQVLDVFNKNHDLVGHVTVLK